MNKKFLVFLIIAALGGGGYYYWHTQLSSSFLTQDQIKIDDEEYQVLSKEEMEDIGLELRMIPNKDNAAILYAEATNKFVEPKGEMVDKLIYVAENKWPKRKSFSDWYSKNKECLKILHQAVEKDDCQFPYFSDDIDNIKGLLLPYLEIMRSFSRLLAVEGKRYESKEDYSKAIDSYLAVGKLSEHLLKSEKTLISHLVYCAIRNHMNRPLEMLMANTELSEDDLRRIIQEYERLQDWIPEVQDCLEEDKLLVEQLIEEGLQNPQTLRHIKDLSDREKELVRRLGPQMRQTYEESYKVLEKWLELPVWVAFAPQNKMTVYLDGLGDRGLLSRMFISSYEKARLQYSIMEALDRGVIIFTAVKLYEKEKGHPPRTLKELELGSYLSSLPKDPFSGKDYIYRTNGREWIFYSVGVNLTDDGGSDQMPHNPRSEGGDKDFVWWSKGIPYEKYRW